MDPKREMGGVPPLKSWVQQFQLKGWDLKHTFLFKKIKLNSPNFFFFLQLISFSCSFFSPFQFFRLGRLKKYSKVPSMSTLAFSLRQIPKPQSSPHQFTNSGFPKYKNRFPNQDLVLRSQVFSSLESILCGSMCSKQVGDQACYWCLVRLKKNPFVALFFIGPTIGT